MNARLKRVDTVVKKLRCPICNAEVPRNSRSLPFCSPRCRNIDLGRWLNEEYTLTDPHDDEEEEEPYPFDDEY